MVWQGQLRDCGPWPCSVAVPASGALSTLIVRAGSSMLRLRAFLQFTPMSPNLDTSFMYMIAGLCMLKLYQKRHPDINASAYSAYACLAIVIFFSVLGVVRP